MILGDLSWPLYEPSRSEVDPSYWSTCTHTNTHTFFVHSQQTLRLIPISWTNSEVGKWNVSLGPNNYFVDPWWTLTSSLWLQDKVLHFSFNGRRLIQPNHNTLRLDRFTELLTFGRIWIFYNTYIKQLPFELQTTNLVNYFTISRCSDNWG